MIAQQPTREESYEAFDRYVARKMITTLDQKAAKTRCEAKKWRHVAKLTASGEVQHADL